MFTHLHNHTEYSFMLDGLSRLESVVGRAKELGMDSLGITDHGGLYGVIDFYRIAREAGIKPIIGCEMYVAPNSRHDRNPGDKTSFHLTVLCKNIEGYRNLVKLVTAAHLEGFYYKPRVDREILQQYHEGLIVLSGCPSGEVPSLISQGRMDDARSAATWYKELFGDYYLELMRHDGVDGLPAINEGLIELHEELGIDVVATNDSHYVHQEDAPIQDVLICIHTNTNVNDENRLKMDDDSYYLKSADEMESLFADVPEAISNSQAIADKCELELDFSQLHMPEYPVPDGLAPDDYLRQLCEEGLQSRFETVTEVERGRLSYELDVIRQTKYANYFLVVWDIARFVREHDIYFAVRGSAAGSIVLYCLGVTDVNPLEYHIVFERFLNVERREMPDIDMDFQDDRREEVLNYVVEKYGGDHVAQIITFGTLGARASIRDVGRALAMPYGDVDQIARMIPNRLNMTLEKAMGENPELEEAYGADEGTKKLVDIAQRLEGITRHASTHAAGVVISQEPLETYVPLQKPTRGDDDSISMTQYAMEPIAALGLLKMDFLGLVNLTVLAKARDLIDRTRGVRLNLKDIPLDDTKTFELLSAGQTVGVFQMEGAGMTNYIQDLKPTTINDVASMIALYRPGPMEHIGTFIDAKHGRAEAQYVHESLKGILEETYGVIVYQDQVFLIVQAFAGYSLGEADVLRKAMGKKIPEIMEKERDKFLNGAIAQGHPQELAEKVFALIEPFAGYGFPKAHAVSYGLISYWTAYLKANFPEEYMVCLLNAYVENTEKLGGSVAECRRLGIEVMPPDVNYSHVEFSVERQNDGGTAVRVGLASVKNVGEGAVTPVIEAREKEGPFASIEQMCRVADLRGLNRKSLESLIKAGAFDQFGDRGALLEVVDRVLSLAQSEASLRESDQTSMFDLFGESVPTPLAQIDLPAGQTSKSEKKVWETELLGVNFADNPLLNLPASDGDTKAIMSRSEVRADMNGEKIELRGQVASVSHRYTKDQKPYSIANIALLDGDIDVLVWQNVLEKTQGLWEPSKLLTIEGRVRARDDRVSISCLNASEFKVKDDGESPDEKPAPEPAAPPAASQVSSPANGASPTAQELRADTVPSPPRVETPAEPYPRQRRLLLRIRETDQPDDDHRLMDDLKQLLLGYQGDDSVGLEIASNGHLVTLDWALVRVNICPPLQEALEEVIGPSGSISIADEPSNGAISRNGVA